MFESAGIITVQRYIEQMAQLNGVLADKKFLDTKVYRWFFCVKTPFVLEMSLWKEIRPLAVYFLLYYPV